jgi:hypothetical protein
MEVWIQDAVVCLLSFNKCADKHHEFLVGKEVKWAIAGRTKNKLEQLKKDIAGQLENAKVLDIDTLIVDTSYVHRTPRTV